VLAFSIFNLAATAWASTIEFSMTDGTNTISWTLPPSPTPDVVDLGTDFAMDAVPILVNGNPETIQITFWNGTNLSRHGVAGGLDIGNPPSVPLLINQYGPALYTGPESAPTFALGEFSLTNVPNPTFSSNLTSNFTLDVTQIPEPSSLLFLSAGMVAIVTARRFRR
jgi:hypothetical protein